MTTFDLPKDHNAFFSAIFDRYIHSKILFMTRNTFGLFYVKVLQFRFFGKTSIIQDLKKIQMLQQKQFLVCKTYKTSKSLNNWLSCFDKIIGRVS